VSLRAEDLRAILEHALGQDAALSMEVVATISGVINEVFRIRTGGQDYALRVRLRETIFRYEKELLKEIIASRFLASDRVDGYADANETILDEVLGSWRASGAVEGSSLLPRMIFQDLSRSIVPYPWVLQGWVQGPLLAAAPGEHYRSAGAAVAGLHAAGFTRFKPSLDDPWRDKSDWLATLRSEGEKLATGLGVDVPWALLLEDVDGQIDGFCLNHNDLQPFNVIASEDGILLIDWDNLQIGPPEFDLVKLKHWTDCDEDGFFRPNPEKYAAFLAGYRAKRGRPLQDAVARVCEVIWLLRVASFETGRAARGRRQAPPFREAGYYLDCLNTLIEGTHT